MAHARPPACSGHAPNVHVQPAGPRRPVANRRGMARSGEALSVYVIRRDFRRVLRGYDPEEVDQHLERVSRWFAEHRVGQEARALEAQLAQREQELSEREAKLPQAL